MSFWLPIVLNAIVGLGLYVADQFGLTTNPDTMAQTNTILLMAFISVNFLSLAVFRKDTDRWE